LTGHYCGKQNGTTVNNATTDSS